jgi:inosine-uridine nucleoside N-ribohydrolase
VLHDPLAVAVTVKPDLITTVKGTVDVETHGLPDRTYGMTIYRKDLAGTTQVAQEVSAGAAVALFMSRVVAPPRKLDPDAIQK